MDKYDYNPKDILDWDSNTGVFTFKGCFKASPKETVSIKIIPDTWEKNRHASSLLAINYKTYEREVQKLQCLQRAGEIKFLEVLNIDTNSYLIFSEAFGTKHDEPKTTKDKVNK